VTDDSIRIFGSLLSRSAVLPDGPPLLSGGA